MIIENVNRLRFIQIPSRQFKKDTGTQVNNSTFIFIADKVFGFPVLLEDWTEKLWQEIMCCFTIGIF